MDSQPVTLLAAAFLTLGGIAVGHVAGRQLSTGDYRIPEDEASHATPPSWWVAPLLGALVVALTQTVGDTAAYAALPAYLLFAWLSVCLVWIDIDVHRLPMGLTRPALPAFALLLLPPTIATGEWDRLVTAAICCIVLTLLYVLFAFLPGGGFGGGDVQLAPTIGLLLGWFSVGHVVVGTLSAFVLGGFGAVVLLITGRAGRKSAMAFGPFMCGGVFVALAGTEQVLAGLVGQ
ncbi:MAG: prepilin peptidase [Knoellia sp.]